jgi:hypothetical protein
VNNGRRSNPAAFSLARLVRRANGPNLDVSPAATRPRANELDGVILLMPDTRQTRAFRGEFADELKTIFTVPARSALRSLSNGLNPGGNALVIL